MAGEKEKKKIISSKGGREMTRNETRNGRKKWVKKVRATLVLGTVKQKKLNPSGAPAGGGGRNRSESRGTKKRDRARAYGRSLWLPSRRPGAPLRSSCVGVPVPLRGPGVVQARASERATARGVRGGPAGPFFAGVGSPPGGSRG